MPRRGGRRRRASVPIPKELRPIVGGAVLVASVRAVDAVWRRVTGRPTPIATPTGDTVPADTTSADPATVRDRLIYAALLGAAMRLARRVGLPKDGPNGRSPA